MYSFFFHFDHVRLRDEEKVCAIITKLQGYVELNGSRSEICRVYLRHIEHLYYKVNNNVFNKYYDTLICLKKDIMITVFVFRKHQQQTTHAFNTCRVV